MDDLLTLPCSIPGLLRRGSSGWFKGRRCVVLEVRPRGPIHIFVGGLYKELWVEPEEVALDLTDATGRAHAAWWLAGEAKWWPAEPNYTTAIWRRWNFDPATTGGCKIGIGPRHWWPWSHEALATLDPNDPRLLPDGSSWVDAEALRLVCLHVAGLEVARA